jgi:hypothetical protein
MALSKSAVVEVPKLDQPFDGRLDLLFPIPPAAELPPDLQTRVRPAREQVQTGVEGGGPTDA